MAEKPIAAGLRLQIILSLLGLMLFAFLPLFFAISSLARVSILATREAGVHAVVRAVAIHVEESLAYGDAASLEKTLDAHLESEGLEAAGVYRGDGTTLAERGRVETLGVARGRVHLEKGGPVALRSDERGYVDARAKLREGELVLRFAPHGESGRDVRFTGLIAIYVALVALALVTFAYFSLTRLIVRPLEELVSAADRVAHGKRSFDVPQGGPREIAELALSVREMATALMNEEAEQKKRVTELLETTRNLIAAREQLIRSERMASVGRLSAGLAHEIGNPIAALLGLIDLVEAGDLPHDTERDFIRRVKREGERIQRIVGNLLEFARPERAFAESEERAAANVEAVTKDVVGLLSPQKGFRNIAFDVQLDPALPDVAISAARLTQVLLNILMNAAQAIAASTAKESGESGESVGSRDAIGRIVIRGRMVEGGPKLAEIVIEDNGPGISADVRETLFEPFVSTKPVGSGTGLGLAVCRGIIEGAGGTIEVDATFQAGARFKLLLRAATPLSPMQSTR